MMKKFLVMVFAMIMIIGCVMAPAALAEEAYEATVAISSETVEKGETVTVSVTFPENMVKLTSVGILVEYDQDAFDISSGPSGWLFIDSVTPNVASGNFSAVDIFAGDDFSGVTLKFVFVSETDAKIGSYGFRVSIDDNNTFDADYNPVVIKGGTVSTRIPCPGHSYQPVVTEPTCTDEGYTTYTCAVCGDSYKADTVDALDHSFTNYVSNGDATCTANGTETAKCDRCDETDTQADEGSKLGHSFTNYVSDNNATCTADGTETAQCDRCDATDTQADEGSKLGHSFTNYVSNNDATCLGDGTKTAECDRCDETDTKDDVGSKLGHSFTNYVSNGDATCTADGTKTAECDRCDETDTKDDVDSKLGHSFTNYVSNNDATCTADGTKTAKCDRCDETDTQADENSKLPHNYDKTEWAKGDETHWYECTCGAKTDEAPHQYGDDDFCDSCNYERGHVHQNLSVVDEQKATCTEGGTKAYYVCPGCLGWFEDQAGTTPIEDKTTVNVEKLGHSFTNYVSNNDATCTADGTETAKCDRCDETDTKDDVDSKLGHSFTNYVSNNDATCTADGTKTAECDRCDETDTLIDEGSKLGHSFTNYVSNNDATCTADGTETAKCDRCEVTDTQTDADSKLGHSFTNYVSNNDATCTADGTKTAKCDRCDETDTQADENTATGHSDGKATCASGAICGVCGEEYGEKDPANHSEIVEVEEEPSTCTTPGTKAHWTCKGCDKLYGDANAAQEITDLETLKLPLDPDNHTLVYKYDDNNHWLECADGDYSEKDTGSEPHSMGDWHIITNATGSKDGLKEKYCDTCDYTVQEKIPATGSGSDKDNSNIPDTGDDAPIALMAAVLTVCAAGVVVLTSKKRKNEN